MAVRVEDAVCVHATAEAILVEVDGEGYWIPNSQVHDDSEVWRQGDEGDLVLKSERFAEKKGLL